MNERQLTTKEKIHILRNAQLHTALQLAIRMQVPVSLIESYCEEAGIVLKKQQGTGQYMNNSLYFRRIRKTNVSQ